MNVYFDNAATTKISENALNKMTEIMTEKFANPSSLSSAGFNAEKEILNAKKIISSYLNCQQNEVFFTSGATESINTVLNGIAKAYKRQGNHIITSTIEHPATFAPLEMLESEGISASYIETDENGRLNLDLLEKSITENTILVSIILVNNEIGTIQNVSEIGKIIKEKNSKTLFHVDAVQAVGKMEINVEKSKIDMLSASAHKFHGPKGIGVLYVKKGVKLLPFILGGGQQEGFRSGTENTEGIAAMAEALREDILTLKANHEKAYEIKKYLADKIITEIPNVKINGDSMEKSSPYILNVSFANIRSEVLLHSLEEKGILVSSGSACSSRSKKTSRVLKALKIEKAFENGTIRLSFSKYSSMAEASYFFEALKEIVPFLRKYNR